MPPAATTVSCPAAELAANYHEQGFVNLGRVMDESQVTAFRDEEERLRHGQSIDPHAKATTIFNSNLCWKSPVVREFCQHGSHLEAVKALIGDDILLWWTQLVTKMPEQKSATSIFPWHQDCGYLDITPTPVTIWVALDDITLENGCLWVSPGSHHKGLLEHARISDDSWHLTLPVAEEGQPILLEAGEAIAFSAYTLHRSLANRTASLRRAFFCEYAVTWAREAATLRPLLPEQDIQVVCGQRRDGLTAR